MRLRWAIAAAPCLALMGACSDGGTGPVGPIVGSLTLDFCSGERPLFFAVQNAGREWTRVDPTADDAFTFDVSERVGIAMTFDFGDEMLTDVYYATRTELALLSERACIESVGGKTVNGSVANVPVGDQVVVSMSSASDTAIAPSGSFTLTQVANGPQDIVAHNEFPTVDGYVPDRVIIRRAQNPTNNATLSALDFSAGTSDALSANLATVTGLSAGETNYLDVYFQTALGTFHTLYLAPFFDTPSQTIYGVPSGVTQAGDLHRLDLQAEATSGSAYRTVRRWYRNAANQALPLGPALTTPSVSSTDVSPYLRLRATLASQVEYPSFATAYFIQGTSTFRSVFVTQTAGYNNGTPGNWAMEIPEIPFSIGYPANAPLVSGQGTQWFVEAFNGQLSDFIGAAPSEGAMVRWAGRTSSVTLLRALRAPGGASDDRTPSRPRVLDKRAFGR